MENKINDPSELLLMDQIHWKKLHEIQYWFIENGVAEYYNTRNTDHLVEYVKSNGYSFSVTPAVDRDHMHKGIKHHTWARLVIQSKHIESQMWCFDQIQKNNCIYEYWVIQEWSKGRKYMFKNCEFIISKALSVEDKREIIHRSNRFFSRFVVNSEFTIYFPKRERDIRHLSINEFKEFFDKDDILSLALQ